MLQRRSVIFALIAALFSSIVTVLVCQDAPPFYFEITLNSSDEGTAQLYYDTGRGINAKDSVSRRLPQGRSVVRLPLPDGEYRALRFDPIDHGYCRLSLGRASITNISGSIQREFSPDEFTIFYGMSRRERVDDRLNVVLSATEVDPSMTAILIHPLKLYSSFADYWWFALKTFAAGFFGALAAMITFAFARKREWHRRLPFQLSGIKAVSFPVLAAFLAVFVCLLARWRFVSPINADEGFFIFYGWLVKNGAIPYRDFLEPKPPMIFFANALGLDCFGLGNFGFRLVPTGLALGSIALFCLAMIRRRVAFWLTVLLTAQVALWLLGDQFHDSGLNDSETYGFSFTILGFSIGSIAVSLRRQTTKIIFFLASGICFGLAVLSKELFLLSVVPSWVLSARREPDNWDWSQLWITATAAASVGICFCGYLLVHHAFVPYLDALRFSRAFAANYCFDIGQAPRGSGASLLQYCWTMLNNELYNYGELAFVFGLWLAIPFLRWRQIKGGSLAMEALTCFLGIVLGMFAITVGYCFWRHYYLMGVIGVVLPAVIGAEALSASLARRKAIVSVAAFVTLSALFGLIAKAPIERMLAHVPSAKIIPIDRHAAEAVAEHSAPGDYILDTDSALLHVVLNRKNPLPVVGFTDEFLAAAIAADIPSMRIAKLRETLEQHLPKVCYFSASNRPRQQMYHRLLFDPLLIDHHYVKIDDGLWYLPDAK